jgi:hypothetical protein
MKTVMFTTSIKNADSGSIVRTKLYLTTDNLIINSDTDWLPESIFTLHTELNATALESKNNAKEYLYVLGNKKTRNVRNIMIRNNSAFIGKDK